MIKYVIFDVFETLVTLHNNEFPYFGRAIAKDMGVPWKAFCAPWRSTEEDRTLGKISFEETIKNIMHDFGCFSEEKYSVIVEKRYAHKKYSFDVMRKDIITMLQGLKQEGCRIGLLSNCYFMERDCIKNSEIYKYLDAVVLSCEVGMAKPEEAFFELCMKKLWQGNGQPDSSQYLYIGDGGSKELETASRLGMTACQAMWYLKDDVGQPVGRMPEFHGFAKPLDVVEYVVKSNKVKKVTSV